MTRAQLLFALLLVAALCAVSNLSAQTPRRFFFAAGLTSELSLYPSGYHLMGSFTLPTALPRTQVLIEGLLGATSQAYDLVGTVNLAVRPLKHSISPYVIGGAGLYADSGIPLALNLGAGVDLPVRFGIGTGGQVREHGLFVELRGYQTHQTFSTLSIGIRR